MLTLSREFRAAIKLADERQYQLARQAGLSPGQLSALLRGIIPARANDVRLRRLAEYLDVPIENAFVEVAPTFDPSRPGVPTGVEFRGRR